MLLGPVLYDSGGILRGNSLVGDVHELIFNSNSEHLI